MARIHEFYDDRVIQFPPRSPDLAILDRTIVKNCKRQFQMNAKSIGILGNRIKKIPPTLIYNLNDRMVLAVSILFLEFHHIKIVIYVLRA
jgi:hypothetical protein